MCPEPPAGTFDRLFVSVKIVASHLSVNSLRDRDCGQQPPVDTV